MVLYSNRPLANEYVNYLEVERNKSGFLIPREFLVNRKPI